MSIKIIYEHEKMKCCLCGKEETNKLHRGILWKAVQVHEEVFYACPEEFPAIAAPVEQHASAALRFLNHVISKV